MMKRLATALRDVASVLDGEEPLPKLDYVLKTERYIAALENRIEECSKCDACESFVEGGGRCLCEACSFDVSSWVKASKSPLDWMRAQHGRVDMRPIIGAVQGPKPPSPKIPPPPPRGEPRSVK